jgi:2'-hydroxyisoflavone reductase
MDILVLGGTRFMGRRLVETALAHGHRVTLFHRGTAGADLFEGQVERILGDRDVDLSALNGRKWDAVVDMPGYVPRVVRKTSELLSSVERYLFISSISVYDPEPGSVSVHEDSRLSTLQDETVEEITPETYGGLKVLCEKVVQEVFGERAIIIRPGYMVGSYDPSDRFTYYPWRMMKGGRMIAGGRKDAPMQVIDAKDIAAFCVSLLEKKSSGTFNVAGPDSPFRWDDFLTRCRDGLGVDTELAWFDAARLEEAGCLPGADLPLYQGMDLSSDPLMRTDNSRAVAAGLTFTPLEDTARDVAEWVKSRGDEPLKVGMSLEREAEVFEALSVEM